MKNLFPLNIEQLILNKIGLNRINEIRFRVNKPIILVIGVVSYFLSENGISNESSSAIIATKEMIETLVFKASECSLYAVNEQLKRGFLSVEGGIRIGLCGTIVHESGEIKTIKDFTSLNIRIPHQIKNCSLSAYSHIVQSGQVKSTLIVSPPGCGKTTFLRDFIYQLSKHDLTHNVFLVDERGEIAGLKSDFDIGDFCDVATFSPKSKGIEHGIRSMNPDIIVVDEISGNQDFQSIISASNSGVKIIASAHASSLQDLKNKEGFQEILQKKCFERYVILSKVNGVGTYEGIFNSNFERVANYF